MRAVWILWLRQLKRYSAGASRMIGSLGQPILILFALGYGFGPIFARAGGATIWNSGAGHHRDGDHFQCGVRWHRNHLGSAVWISEGDAGRAGAAAGDRARAHAGGRDDRDAARGDRPDDLPIAGFTSRSRAVVVALVFMFLIALVFSGDRHGDRVGTAGHAGVPADHEFPCPPVVFFLERAVPGGRIADAAADRRAAQSAELRRGGNARRTGRRRLVETATDLAVLGTIAVVLLGVSSFLFSRIEV